MLDTMLGNYFPILLFILIGLAVGVLSMLAGWLFAPNRPDSEKLSPYEIGMFGFMAMLVFLSILIVGFVYEWKKGALEWD